MIHIGISASRAGLSLRTCLVLLCLALPSLAGAEVYKWVDDDGKTNYTQLPPPPGHVSEIVREAPPPPAAPPAPDARLQKRMKEEQADKKGDATMTEQEKKIADIRQLNCDAATRNLAALEERSQRRYLTADGEYLRPTEEDRQKLIDQASKQIKEYCTE